MRHGLIMTDAIQYFEKQQKIYPKRVWGTFRKLKWAVMALAFAVYYLTPFLRWERGPHVPDQAILIDMANHRLYFFAIEIWPQEVYYLVGILVLAAVGMFFVTSLLGRVWCGYFCFQTIWTDLFVWVERIVQGDRNARKKIDESPWNFTKLRKKLLTHIIWLVISAFTGGAWVLYFNDAPTLMEDILHLSVPLDVLGWIIALTISTYIMAGLAREQVCVYMCPYSRFQSAMFDKDTLIIGYDPARGEPRGKYHKSDKPTPCIDCSLCVQVCPMGIDIRDGLQYECIACGLCIDACDSVMDKLQEPRKMIRYDSLNNISARAEGRQENPHFLRPRTFWYAGIMSVVIAMMLVTLLNRSLLELHVLHDRNPLFVMLSDGQIRNGYQLKILNKTHEDRTYSLTLQGLQGAQIRLEGVGTLETENMPVFAESVGQFRVFVTAPKPAGGRQEIIFSIRDTQSGATDQLTSIFLSEK
jgi:cytochrome c oxidase accessory protein FixG